jgi:hypothetical protein
MLPHAPKAKVNIFNYLSYSVTQIMFPDIFHLLLATAYRCEIWIFYLLGFRQSQLTRLMYYILLLLHTHYATSIFRVEEWAKQEISMEQAANSSASHCVFHAGQFLGSFFDAEDIYLLCWVLQDTSFKARIHLHVYCQSAVYIKRYLEPRCMKKGTLFIWFTLGPGVYSASNRNEHQKH